MKDDKYYTIREASTLAGVHPNTIRRLVKAERLPAVKVRGKHGEEYRISESDLYQSGIPMLNQQLGPAMVNDRVSVRDNGNGQEGSVISPKELIVRIEELNRKLGGYEYAAKALNEAKEEREEYRQKYLSAEEENILLQKRVIELQAKVYTPWWRRRAK